ncbi:c-type cytochrome biogenesis protein CcsB, partial [Streptosporangium minutum]
MPAEVDAGLALLSDQLILATVLLYVFAMIGYALDLGFGRSKVKARAVAEPALVTVGGGPAAPPASE